MESKKLGVALVGLGGYSEEQLAPALLRNKTLLPVRNSIRFGKEKKEMEKEI